MASLTVQQRAIGAVVGSLLADAAAVPVHWIYDLQKLDGILSSRPNPEFIEKSHCPFYTIATGSNTCYGDQTFVALESLVESEGFNKDDYKKRLEATFGATSQYEVNLGHPPTKADMPIPGPWRNGSIKHFLQAYAEGRDKTGKESDAQADGFAKAAPLAALYAGDPCMYEVVEEVVRVTQDDPAAVSSAVAAARILEDIILHGSPAQKAVVTGRDTCSGEVVAHIKTALEASGTPHGEAVKEFGTSCGLPGSFKGCIHNLAVHEDYLGAVRACIRAGGDNCSRNSFVGAAFGAMVGLGGLPPEWIQKTSRGTQIVQLAERLVALRKQ